MSIDVVTLALAKAYTDELVANGGDPEKTEQIIRDKIDEVLGELGGIGGSADWAVNDETAAGYIKNRTHCDLGEICIPNKTNDGAESYWEGPTGNEVYGQDYFVAMELDGTYFYAYRVLNSAIDFKDMDSINGDNLILNYSGVLTKGSEIFEDFESQELVPNYVKAIIADGIPLLVSVIEEFDLSLVGQEGVAPSGIYFIYTEREEEKVFLTQAKYPKIKQLDLKYIPDLAFGDIDMVDYGTYAKVTVTKRDGSVQTITINDGPAGEPGPAGYSPIRGTDYWTASDIAQIKSYVDSAILGGSW